MKSLMLLWKSVADNLAARCCTCAHQDFKTVLDRSKNEGISFLTICLPNFAKDFELCLERGYVDNTVFLSFKKNRSLPAFLQGFSCLIFDRTSGVLLDKPDIEAIRAVRQLTLLYSKILLNCKPSRIERAFNEFVECEQEVRDWQIPSNIKSFERIRTLLFGSLFSSIDKDVYEGNIRPSHGPGATADSLYGNQKFNQTTWPSRLEPYFPFGSMVLPSWSYWEQIGEVDFLEPGSEIPVKVISVPKTMKTPRIIAIEPTAMQYAQQAIRRLMYDGVKSSFLDTYIGFDDQAPNQRLAREGSLLGDLATLDLSEASDRVSNELVHILLARHPHMLAGVMSCRSSRARLPSGESLDLAKFASMGSALCFPIEAMVFLTIVFVGIEKSLERQLTRKDIESYAGQVRVYGDDIIVPVDSVRFVIDSLEAYGLKVNRNKSYWNGKFRESCGKEYYEGNDVSIVRCRRILPTSRRDAQEIISAVSLRNQLFHAGLEIAVAHLDRDLHRILVHFPTIGVSSPVLGRHTYDPINKDTRFINSIPMVKGWKVQSRIPMNEINDWPALRKCFDLMDQRLFDEIATSSDHLRRSGRPRVVSIKLGLGHAGY